MAQPNYQGRFIWTELLCNDAASAAAFYARILPWQSQPFSPGSPYLVFSGADGAPIAGNMSLPTEARAMGTVPHWRAYIGAADVDAIVAQASRLGARILEPARDLPAVGRAALLADPEGARFGVYRPLNESGPSATPGEAPFPWYELAARSRETALAFYQQLFGWELRAPMDMGGGFFYQTFGLGSQDFGGCYTIPVDRPMPPAWCPYARSSSADEVAGKVVAAGGQLCHGPVDVPNGGRIVQFFDPQHAMFAVVSMTAAAPAKPAMASKPAAAAKPVTPARRATKKPASKPKKKAAKRPAAKSRKPARKTAKPKARRAAAPKRKSSRKPARRAARKAARKSVRRKPARKK